MYYVVYGLLYLISLLPLPVLYLLSDAGYFIIYHLTGYRKSVVLHNLSIAFPGKTDVEKENIAKKFYRNFCDTFIESIKFISADEGFFRKHFTADYALIKDLYRKGSSVQLNMGHNFNWELANLVMPFFMPFKILVVYLPLGSKLVDRLFKTIRSKNGTHLIAATNLRNEVLPHRNSQYIMALIADQSPPIPQRAYWINFFGTPTAFLQGPEKYARLYNVPVVFCHFTKTERGYYQGHETLATLHPRELPEGELTRLYALFLENVMTAHPEMWLWSHRRWKLTWKPEYGMVLN